VECAHPVAEDLTVGLLYIGANTLAIVLTFVGQVLLAAPVNATGPSPLFPWALWSLALMLVGLLAILAYSGKYLRLEQDTTRPLIGVDEKDSDDNDRLRSIGSKCSSDF